jgi:hypothetical protein
MDAMTRERPVAVEAPIVAVRDLHKWYSGVHA